MNKETYEALKTIIDEARLYIKFSSNFDKQLREVEGWILEVKKEYE